MAGSNSMIRSRICMPVSLGITRSVRTIWGCPLKNEVEALFRVCRGNNIHTLPGQRAGHEFDAAGVVIDYDDAHVGLRIKQKSDN